MSFQEPEVRVMFPTPFLTIQLDGAEKLNRRLLKEIGKRRSAEPGIDRSNRYGWHSGLDLFQRTEPAHARLTGYRPPRRARGRRHLGLGAGGLAWADGRQETQVHGCEPSGLLRIPHHVEFIVLQATYLVMIVRLGVFGLGEDSGRHRI